MHKLINNRTIQVSCLPVFGVGGLFVIALIAYTDAISIYFKFLSQTEWSPPHEFLLSYYYLIVNSGYIYDYYVPVIILSALGISTHFSPTKTYSAYSYTCTFPVKKVLDGNCLALYYNRSNYFESGSVKNLTINITFSE